MSSPESARSRGTSWFMTAWAAWWAMKFMRSPSGPSRKTSGESQGPVSAFCPIPRMSRTLAGLGLFQRAFCVGRTFGGRDRHPERPPVAPDLKVDLVARFQRCDQQPRLLRGAYRLVVYGQDHIAVRESGDGGGTVRDYSYQDADVSLDAERGGFRPRQFLRIYKADPATDDPAVTLDLVDHTANEINGNGEAYALGAGVLCEYRRIDAHQLAQ